MPVTYLCDSGGLLRTRCSGDVTFDEVLEHFRQLKADSSLPRRLDVLLDLTEMDSLPDTRQLQRVAHEVGLLQPAIEWGALAIVARRDPLFGMSRALEAFAGTSVGRTRVFRSLDEAEGWLSAEDRA